MLNFYDYKVIEGGWLVVVVNTQSRQQLTICNDRDVFVDYFKKHKNEIWIGCNSFNRDPYILKAILLNMNVKRIYDYLTKDGLKGWQIDSRFKNVTINSYDVAKKKPLQTLFAFMGKDITDYSAKYETKKTFTDEEIQELIKSCSYNVNQTMEIFLQRENDFNAQASLIKTFGLPLEAIGRTQAQLASMILKARKQRFDDWWNIRLPDTLKLDKYKYIADWFLNKKNHHNESTLNCKIAGLEHSIGWGGLHGAKEKYKYVCKNDEMIVHADVDQLYPTIMIKYDLLSRAVREKDRYKNIVETSLRLKAEEKEAERKPYKDISNITYGGMGDEYNFLYDPLYRNLVCVFGQVLIIDLIEKIEGISELIQSNTDGLFIKINNNDFDLLDDIVYEWEKRTGLKMSFKFYKSTVQKDVNSYVAVDYDGNLKRKGEYVKALSDIDYDLPIVNEAVVKYLTENILPEDTIRSCNELKKFQRVVRVSENYICAWHNGKQLEGKTFRIFASADTSDKNITKQKTYGATKEKFAKTPERCFIDNGDITNKTVPYKLDKQWYIDMAIKRIEDFGLNASKYQQLELL